MCHILTQGDVEAIFCFHLERVVTNVGDNQGGTFIAFQLEFSVEVGYRTIGCALLHDGGTDDVLSGVILHMATDGGLSRNIQGKNHNRHKH